MDLSTPKCANKRRSTVAASKFSMMDDKMAVNAEMLNSWKEVAVYLGRGIRTVQRWELDLGLPVRRPRGKPRSAVIALKTELDRWLTSTAEKISSEELSKETSIKKTFVTTPGTQALHRNTELLVTKTRLLLERSFDLCTQSQQLFEQLNRVLTVAARLAMKKRPQPPLIIQNTETDRTRKAFPPPELPN